MKIRLYDSNFSHHAPASSLSSFPGRDVYPKYIEWVRDPNVYTDVAFFTDNCLNQVDSCDAQFKFAWILEPQALVPGVYGQISKPELYNKFYKVLTHDNELLSLDGDKFIQYNFGGCWISREDHKIYPKNKNICIIASHKRDLPGHKLRHEIIENISQKYNIDIYGNAYRYFANTVDVLKDYRFCIVVENIKKDYWFTEKLIQCFRVGTIPLYYGTSFNKNINLDERGIFNFSNLQQLESLLPLMTQEMYNYKVDKGVVSNNFYVSKKYAVCEDHLYKDVLSKLLMN